MTPGKSLKQIIFETPFKVAGWGLLTLATIILGFLFSYWESNIVYAEDFSSEMAKQMAPVQKQMQRNTELLATVEKTATLSNLTAQRNTVEVLIVRLETQKENMSDWNEVNQERLNELYQSKDRLDTAIYNLVTP